MVSQVVFTSRKLRVHFDWLPKFPGCTDHKLETLVMGERLLL